MTQPLRIMTYNVRYFSHGTRGLVSTAWAMKGIAKAIASLDPLPHIVCLQEVETASVRANLGHPQLTPEDTQLSRLLAMLHESLAEAGKPDGYSAYYFPAHTYRLTRRRNFYTTGLAIIASKDFEIAHHNSLQPCDITHRRIEAVRDLKQTRISAHVRFTYKSSESLAAGAGSSQPGSIASEAATAAPSRPGSIDVFNTHLSLPALWTREFWRRGQRMGYGLNQLAEAKNLADFIDAERASDNYFVVGDLNALPGSPLHRYLVEERGLRDAFRVVQGGDDALACKWPTAGFLHLRMHLDHILTGPGLEWVDFDESVPFGKRGSRFHGLSDHVPLIARCQLR